MIVVAFGSAPSVESRSPTGGVVMHQDCASRDALDAADFGSKVNSSHVLSRLRTAMGTFIMVYRGRQRFFSPAQFLRPPPLFLRGCAVSESAIPLCAPIPGVRNRRQNLRSLNQPSCRTRPNPGIDVDVFQPPILDFPILAEARPPRRRAAIFLPSVTRLVIPLATPKTAFHGTPPTRYQ